MKTVLRTKVFNGTWMGGEGTSTTHHLDKNRVGLRINVFALKNSEVVEVSLIKGDGRHIDFKVLAKVKVAAHEVDAAVEAMLAM